VSRLKACLHAHTRTHTHTRTHARMHARMHAHTQTSTHARTHKRTHARTHTHTHTHTHTNTHTCISAHKAHTSCQFTVQKASPTFQHRLRCFPLLVGMATASCTLTDEPPVLIFPVVRSSTPVAALQPTTMPPAWFISGSRPFSCNCKAMPIKFTQ